MSEMSSSSTPSKEDAGSGCRIAEIVQYTCGLETNGQGKPQLHCFPIPRLFRMCRGQPSVEITTLIKIDMDSGEVEIPPESSQLSIRGQTWRDITRYVKEYTDPSG
ncbi:uncharacterized protein LACBIDRAFT_319139 [Laccaria bicolor S238N-H82]|uniref:Predicted protein n=1 Tax=Laccaria bicolor (strain S238N-H82 / ATCC MYA-4686) TaxID=486041 RepID=B0D7Y9_LACBS|nr:uncharacterized protein LACBIDRAFT_319139 [Laccaria bicolor S238N-H82]EDR09727.1 predicted protein [Laccaria bicolor S238N-H82]|eukprot:XP_001880076.1 predicted protein [Laccaria bicolor S238N-H82]